MRHGARRRVLDDVRADAAELLSGLDGIVDRIVSAQAGDLSAQRIDQDRVTGVTVDHESQDEGAVPVIVDPTAGAALARVAGHDRAARDLLELDRQLFAAQRAMDRAIRIARAYAPAHVAGPGERSSTIAEPGCASCARLPGAHGGRRWEPVYSHTSIDGRRVALCRWCWVQASEIRKATGRARMPPRADLEWHHQGRRVRRPDKRARP